MRLQAPLGLGFCVALAGGCASDPSPEERLAGTWTAETPSGCTLLIALTDDNHYSLGMACELDSGGTGFEIEAGDYEATTKRLKTTPTKASCPKKADPTDDGYSINGDVLTLIEPEGAIVFQRLKDTSDAMGTVAFGCWNKDLTFTPGKLQKL